MKCPKCGAELPRNSLRCQKCIGVEETIPLDDLLEKKAEEEHPCSSRKKGSSYQFLSALKTLAGGTKTEEVSGYSPRTRPYKGFSAPSGGGNKLSDRIRFSGLKTEETIQGNALPIPEQTVSYILCPPFQPMKLKRDVPFTIGREETNMLYLPSREVSRFHANIVWKGEEFVIRDMESANGTFVNDDYVTEHVLQDGDKIYIGTNTILYREVPLGLSVHIPKTSLKETLRISIGGKAAEKFEETSSQSSFKGDIETIGLFPILQMLGLDGKSGCMSIAREGECACIYFVDGLVVHCEYRGLKGMEAFFEIMRFSEGKFDFDAAKAPQEISMTSEIEMLLLECARRMDEENKSQYM